MVTENQTKKIFQLPKWQEYVLNRLNHLYNKGELCDVTLKFGEDSTVIQAHKVILKACSSFFDVLPSASGGVVLHMPKNIKPAHVTALINCMYTGKLEYVPGEQNVLCVVAKQLGMNFIVEILQKQAGPMPSAQPSQPKSDSRPVLKKYAPKHVPPPPMPTLVPTAASTPMPSSQPTEPPDPHQVAPPSTSEAPSPVILPGKKLPIWKQRTTINLPEEFYRTANKKLPPVVPLEPKPSRFELSEERLPDFTESCENLSYESQVIVTPCEEPKPVISEHSIERMPTTPTILLGKRARVSEVIRGSTEEEDDYDDGHFESIHDIDEDPEEDDSTISSCDAKALSTPPKPILKTISSPSPSKKVRFAASTVKKALVTPNNSRVSNEIPSTPSTPTSTPPSVIQKITVPTSAATTATASTPPNSQTIRGSYNHAKIINEVLKRYPHMSKSKNIKVKIQGSSPGFPTSTSSTDKDGKSEHKVHYIVYKSDLNNLQKEAKDNPVNGAENTTGPWTCVTCGTDDGPIHFDSYYNYRRHLHDIHNEKVDARICEYCGHKASKRNLHLYHLYTKHNISPPRNIHFPKCDQCSYIALSESLLIKHRSNHTGMVTKEFICRLCNAAFKSHGALMGHMQTNLHQTDQAAKKDYECEYCGKIFNRNINLKAHIRTSHQEESIRKLYDDEDKTDDPPEVENPADGKKMNQTMELIEVPVYDSVSGQNQTIYLPQGMTILTENPSAPLLPSSESEAMNNVATGIATSINIADRNIANDVVVIDGGQTEIILRGAPTAYVMNPDGSYSLQEYIVPEIMSESGQVYTTALVSSAPATGITYVNTDNISIITPSDHTYADGTKVNGHISATTPVTIVSSVNTTPLVQTEAQKNQAIMVQDPIIVNTAEWVQKMATTQNQDVQISQTQSEEIISQPLNQRVEIISSQPLSQNPRVEIISQSVGQNEAASEVSQSSLEVSCESQAETEDSSKTAQTLVSDWGDLDDEEERQSQDADEESENKPSRPTIELEPTSELDM